jgi:hypothetical protein
MSGVAKNKQQIEQKKQLLAQLECVDQQVHSLKLQLRSQHAF